MDTHPTFRTILLSVFTTIIALLVVGAWLFSASNGLSQSTAPDGPVTNIALIGPASPSSGEGAQTGETPLIPASLGGDGNPAVNFQAQAVAELGPDAPEEPDVTFSYYRLVGTAFNPRTSTTTFS